MEKQAKLEQYQVPTSKGDQEKKPATTSKCALKETVQTVPKIKNITFNTVDDQEPLSRRIRSSNGNKTLKIIQNTSEPISQRTRSKNFGKNIQHTPTQGHLPHI